MPSDDRNDVNYTAEMIAKGRLDFVANQVEYQNEKLIAPYMLYLRSVTPIIAGIIWVDLQQKSGMDAAHIHKYGALANILVIFFWANCSFILIAHFAAWLKYRSILNTMLLDLEYEYTKIKTKKWQSSTTIVAMLGSMAIACVGFCYLNPISPWNTFENVVSSLKSLKH